MDRFTLEIPILGHIDICCKDIKLAEFAKRQFFVYVNSEKEGIENSNSDYLVQITTQVDFAKCGLDAENGNRSRQFSVQNGEIRYRHIILQRMDNGKIRLAVNGRVKREEDIESCNGYPEYHSMFYDKILFPIFVLYAITNSCFLIHGSLLRLDKKIILICGLDGVGKSTITSELQRKGAKVLSDNFVLFNGENAIPLNLTMRLGVTQNTDMKVIYQDENLKEVVEIYREDNALKIDSIYLLGISELFSSDVKKINLFNLVLYLNNAPEISSANTFIGPFLWNAEMSKTSAEIYKDITVLQIPLGRLSEGVEVIWNDSKIVG